MSNLTIYLPIVELFHHPETQTLRMIRTSLPILRRTVQLSATNGMYINLGGRIQTKLQSDV
jgi:hypothetical protein